ncbi:MAG: porin [Prosthecochloris sp.]|uniref:outer membrane protein n=1 Tax=Prosthecochloris sp. TaxID=290513 RepID=UPI0013CB6542|nr:outer membrane beta-barrel protein [Prosthecochloris sp.]NEX12420.1 porin [Prosthecochloris sp.]
MKKALSLVMVFLVAVAFSATGYSADKYVSGNIGISWMGEASFDESYDWSTYRDGMSLDNSKGVSLTGAFGCDYGDYRAEAELGYQSGDVDNMTIIEAYAAPGIPQTDPMTGDVSVLSLMGNGYYDIDLGGVELFLTAGAGIAQVDLDNVAEVYSNGDVDAYNWNVSEVTLAYQIGAGLALPVADNVMVEARYRYFATTDFTISNDYNANDSGQRRIDDIEYKGNIDSHSALIGLRIML